MQEGAGEPGREGRTKGSRRGDQRRRVIEREKER